MSQPEAEVNPSGGIETADVVVRVAWVCGVAVRRSVGPPAVTLVVAASRRRLYDIAALVAPGSVALYGEKFRTVA